MRWPDSNQNRFENGNAHIYCMLYKHWPHPCKRMWKYSYVHEDIKAEPFHIQYILHKYFNGISSVLLDWTSAPCNQAWNDLRFQDFAVTDLTDPDLRLSNRNRVRKCCGIDDIVYAICLFGFSFQLLRTRHDNTFRQGLYSKLSTRIKCKMIFTFFNFMLCTSTCNDFVSFMCFGNLVQNFEVWNLLQEIIQLALGLSQ